MKIFLKKIFLLVLPFFIILVCYFITDPFKKIWKYDSYFCSYVMLNRGDVSTRVYLKNLEKYKYDSFIFGSSRSTAYASREWSKYLPQGSVAYSFGSWNEPIIGIYKKLCLIDSLKGTIKNALLIFDVDRTFIDPPLGLINDHFLISGISKFDYYLNDFRGYLKNPNLMLSSVDYSLFHKKRAYMDGFVGMKKTDLDPVNNDWEPNSESVILEDSANYYNKAKDKFYKRPATQTYAPREIDEEHKMYLLKIAAFFKKYNTNYKIVIGPLYDQVKFHPEDMALLKSIFKQGSIYDYSGINDITNDIYNFCSDVIHYRKKVGNMILKDIYSK
jgi:hypothetical protein